VPGPYPESVDTERLHLRLFRADDIDAYERILADPAVIRWLGGEPTEDMRREAWWSMAMHAGHWVLRGFGIWAVTLRGSDEMIGRAGLWHPVWWPEPEAAWTFAREHWGNGYATEVGREALHLAFNALSLDHVVSYIRHDNVRSIRVAEKRGGRLEQRTVQHGVETLVYGYAAAAGR